MKVLTRYSVLFAGMLSLLLVSVSCEEFQPVFTGKYKDPEPVQPVTMTPTHTIAELAAAYEGSPFVVGVDKFVGEEVIIGGRVSTTDQPGNFYKSFYIQDKTGGMEIKMGKNGLYNDYKPGQMVYVKCNDLSVGMYGKGSSGNGMVQVGYADPTQEYETSYIESQLLIDTHVFAGEKGDPVEPVVLTEDQLPGSNGTLETCPYLGTLVTLKGLKYANETFVLIYINNNLNKKESSNRIFLSDKGTWGITTWAMSETKFLEYLETGEWDECKVGNKNDYSYGVLGDYKDGLRKNASPYSVSQYFTFGGTEVQIRTSGYCKFADTEIDPDVLAGKKTIDVTGIMTLYQGKIQFVLLDIDGVHYN